MKSLSRLLTAFFLASGAATCAADLLDAESALWPATANHLQPGDDRAVSQARLLYTTGELALGSFRPAVAGVDSSVDSTAKTNGTPSSSGTDSRTLAHYLAWHEGVTTCECDIAAESANTDVSSDKSLPAKNLARPTIQQDGKSKGQSGVILALQKSQVSCDDCHSEFNKPFVEHFHDGNDAIQ